LILIENFFQVSPWRNDDPFDTELKELQEMVEQLTFSMDVQKDLWQLKSILKSYT